MSKIKISSKMDRKVWAELKKIADESQRTISGVLTEAASDYVRRRRVRPEVLRHLEDSIAENRELAWLLSK